MLIDRSPRQTCRIFSLPVGSPVTALTVPPDADAVAAMDGDMQSIKAYVLGDEVKEIELYIAPMTEDEKNIVKAGCLINFNRKN